MSYLSVMGKGAVSVLAGVLVMSGAAGAKPLVAQLGNGNSVVVTVPDKCAMDSRSSPSSAICHYGAVEAGGTTQITVRVWVSSIDQLAAEYSLTAAEFAKNPNGYLQGIMQAEEKVNSGGDPGPTQKLVTHTMARQTGPANPAGFEECMTFNLDYTSAQNGGVFRADNTGLRCAHYDPAAQMVIYAMIEHGNLHTGVESRSPNFAKAASKVLRSMQVQ